MAHDHNNDNSKNIGLAFFLNFLSAHVVITEDASPVTQIELKEEIRRVLSENNIHHVTVEIDFPDENCKGVRCQF